MDIIERLLNMCRDIRRKPIPVSGVIPLMQEASADLARLRAENERLRAAAQAVIERWDSPKWKDEAPTADVISALRAAVAQGKV